MISNPTGPVEEIGILPREADQQEDRLHHRLLDGVHERGEPDRVFTIVLLRNDEGKVSRDGSVELDYSRAGCQRNLVYLADDVVRRRRNLVGRSLQKGVPIGGEDVAPWQREQSAMKVTRRDVVVADLVTKEAMQFLSTEGGPELLGLRLRRRRQRTYHVRPRVRMGPDWDIAWRAWRVRCRSNREASKHLESRRSRSG